MAIPRELRRKVIERARNRCEYCRTPAELDVAHFEIDHIRAQVHGGETASIAVLNINAASRVGLRKQLIEEGVFPLTG